MIKLHKPIPRMNQRHLLLRINLSQIRRHLNPNSATTNNHNRLCILDALLIRLEVINRRLLFIMLHVTRRLESCSRRDDSVLKGDFCGALPWSVDSELVLLKGYCAGADYSVVGGVGEGGEEAGVGDEGFVFVVWHYGEPGLRRVSMSEQGLRSDLRRRRDGGNGCEALLTGPTIC